MGYLIVAFGTVFLLIVGHIQEAQRMDIAAVQQVGSGPLLARQMLMLASSINDWRYRHPVSDGTVPLAELPLAMTPDPRISHVIVNHRLWIWMADRPGLVDALRTQSGGSALIGTVVQNRLIWLTSGVDAVLPLAPGIKNGDVVYLN